MNKPFYLSRYQQRGIALIASLVIMLLMTIIALSVMRSNNLFEKMAGNTREKQRALQSAESALLYGEYWLNSSGAAALTPVSCSTTAAFTAMQVCNVDPGASAANIANLKWFTYTLAGITLNPNGTIGGLVQTGATTGNVGDVYYASNPGVYISFVANLQSGAPLYRVTAIGYGGTGGKNGTVAVVQSLYALGVASGGSPGGSGGSTPGISLGDA